MVLRIRLARHGRRNRAFYRIVAADSRSPRDGRFLEVLGFYNPLAFSRQEAQAKIKRVGLNVPRIRYWLSVGAQPSNTVGRLLGTSGLLPCHPRTELREDVAESSMTTAKTIETDPALSGPVSGPISLSGRASRGLTELLFDSSPGIGMFQRRHQ